MLACDTSAAPASSGCVSRAISQASHVAVYFRLEAPCSPLFQMTTFVWQLVSIFGLVIKLLSPSRKVAAFAVVPFSGALFTSCQCMSRSPGDVCVQEKTKIVLFVVYIYYL